MRIKNVDIGDSTPDAASKNDPENLRTAFSTAKGALINLDILVNWEDVAWYFGCIGNPKLEIGVPANLCDLMMSEVVIPGRSVEAPNPILSKSRDSCAVVVCTNAPEPIKSNFFKSLL